jgi:CheY-like chemotaxis protein
MNKTRGATLALTHRGSGGARKLPTSSRATVLHVDDDPNDTALLEAARRKAGVDFRLQNVGDGEQAIAYLNGTGKYANRSSHPWPTLILLDLKMPRATGFEILKWIRNHPNCKNLPVVVLSGSELQEDMHQAYLVGANSYLVKPLGFDALVKLVKNFAAAWLAPRPVVLPAIAPDSHNDMEHYRPNSSPNN